MICTTCGDLAELHIGPSGRPVCDDCAETEAEDEMDDTDG